jgi:type II secretory pathway component GspD/PulD (secretin)
LIRLPVLAAILALGAPAFAQPPGPPPPVPVVRLDGATGGPLVPPQQAQPPGRPEPAPVTRLDDPGRAALDGAPSISLAISSPMPLRDLLRLLVSGTGLSIVFDDGVEGEFEGELHGLTLRQATEAVLFSRGMDYEAQGTLIRVFPRRPRTRLFDIEYLNVRRALRDARSASAVPAGDAAAVRLPASLDSDPLTELAGGVRALLSASGQVHVDRSAGLVQVTDFADRLDQVAVYLAAVHARASRQVRLEARIFEVTLRDPAAAAVDWEAVVQRSAGAVTANRSAAGLLVGDFEVLLRAVAEQGSVRTIAAPQILAMNNEPVVLRVGTREVHFEPASRLVDTRALAPAAVHEGLVLTVTAQVASDGIVQLHIAPTYTENIGETRSYRGQSAPVLSFVEADSQVRVRDGHTVVIAGLLQDRVRTTPGTGLSGLFGAQSREPVRSELIILLTPVVVGPGVPGSAAH